jgi:protein-tyrosine phosphatase
MGSFLDIHCHILPNVDDGPQSMDEALILAQALLSAGISHVIATPHYVEDFTTTYRNQIKEQHLLLVNTLKQEGMFLSVSLGGEITLTPQVAELAKKQKLPTLNDTPYVLLELPFFQPVPHYTKETIFTMQTSGYRPILAHPERTAALQKDKRHIQSLARSGVLFQINTGSLCGHFGKSAMKLAYNLVDTGMAHFLATDSHTPACLKEIEKLSASNDLPFAALTHHNPSRLLDGALVDPVAPIKQYSLFRRICRNFI